MLYAFCEIGETITNRFEALGDKVYQLNWYTLPLSMQKDLVRVIAISQKRVFVRGYLDIQSSRQVFKKVIFTRILKIFLAKQSIHLIFQILGKKLCFILFLRKV